MRDKIYRHTDRSWIERESDMGSVWFKGVIHIYIYIRLSSRKTCERRTRYIGITPLRQPLQLSLLLQQLPLFLFLLRQPLGKQADILSLGKQVRMLRVVQRVRGQALASALALGVAVRKGRRGVFSTLVVVYIVLFRVVLIALGCIYMYKERIMYIYIILYIYICIYRGKMG